VSFFAACQHKTPESLDGNLTNLHNVLQCSKSKNGKQSLFAQSHRTPALSLPSVFHPEEMSGCAMELWRSVSSELRQNVRNNVRTEHSTAQSAVPCMLPSHPASFVSSHNLHLARQYLLRGHEGFDGAEKGLRMRMRAPLTGAPAREATARCHRRVQDAVISRTPPSSTSTLPPFPM